jgi:hypothetical protein
VDLRSVIANWLGKCGTQCPDGLQNPSEHTLPCLSAPHLLHSPPALPPVQGVRRTKIGKRRHSTVIDAMVPRRVAGHGRVERRTLTRSRNSIAPGVCSGLISTPARGRGGLLCALLSTVLNSTDPGHASTRVLKKRKMLDIRFACGCTEWDC